MFYEFERRDGTRRLVRSSAGELPALIERMKAEGWRRLYSVPSTITVPSYNEAREETHELIAAEERQRAHDRREAAEDLARAVKEEYGSP